MTEKKAPQRHELRFNVDTIHLCITDIFSLVLDSQYFKIIKVIFTVSIQVFCFHSIAFSTQSLTPTIHPMSGITSLNRQNILRNIPSRLRMNRYTNSEKTRQTTSNMRAAINHRSSNRGIGSIGASISGNEPMRDALRKKFRIQKEFHPEPWELLKKRKRKT